ncbi:glycosyltransferase [Variovorax sp. J22G21]|uniref:glycosyltransferase n=1 Tax=Variovorax fucosicus TaxID=3053517 RepID=UPI0025788B7D|nr:MULTISPECIES: glycosyltransferase [unclassified Variovorax]MDM0038513.1 glycosyltransferase [Variovorax sp. J22R193]MDM0063289.1 glycosyltransferase [Variovorax sp. J22G21]
MTVTSFFPTPENDAFRRALRNIEQGFYVRVGALSQGADSVLRAFAERGWSGIEVVADPAAPGVAWADKVPEGQAVHLMVVDALWLEAALSAGQGGSAPRPWLVAIAPADNEMALDSDLARQRYVFVHADDTHRYYAAAERGELHVPLRRDAGAWQDRSRQLEIELADARVRARVAEKEGLRAEHEEREARLSAEALSARLQDELRANEAARAGAEHNAVLVAQMRASASWRITAPLRRVVPMISPALRQHARRLVKAAWWAATPWRMPQRVRFIQARRTGGAGGQAPSGSLAPSPSIPLEGQYAEWIRSGEKWSDAAEVPRNDLPLVSFLVFAGTDNNELTRTLESIRGQRHGEWEAIVCAGVAHSRELGARVGALADDRIRVVDAAAPDKASCLATGFELAVGEFIAVLDAGDVLAAAASNEIAAALQRLPEADILYSDEDTQSAAGAREAPYFKPGWSPDLLYAFNYFGRLTLWRRALVAEVGGFDRQAGAAVEWDLNLRASDSAQRIGRIPKVLCHLRNGADRGRPESGTSGAADGRAVIERYWARSGFEARAETQPDGTQRVMWALAKPPLVSVVIPTRNKPELLRMCIDGLLRGTDYDNKEIVIVDTGSDDPATLAYYGELAQIPCIRIVHFLKKFNYSAACNYGASFARGDLLLFLNNDIEVVSRDWLQELVSFAVRPGVGVVGTKLIYPSGELQHGGVGVGIHLAALMYRSAEAGRWDVFGSAEHPRNWLAIMGACQLVRRDAFEQVGGFDESYLVAMSDVALCLRIWRAGFRTAYAPHACLVHHEGATRGNSNPVMDVRRIADDIRALGIDEDPYLHPELDGHVAIPTLRIGAAPSVREILQIRLREDGSPVLPARILDLTDDGACLQACSVERDELLWPPQPVHQIRDKWSAARWCLDLLRTRSDLRLRFPQALSEGASGGFVRWLKGEGRQQLHLPAGWETWVDALFAEDLSARARQIFLYRADVRLLMPHGLTPIGQRELLRWFARHGRPEFKLRLEEIWWLFWEAAENPARELVRAYLFNPDWQRLYPDALTVFGQDAFAAWFSATYRIHALWVRPGAWPLTATPAQQIRTAYHARESWRLAVPNALGDATQAAALIDWLQSDEAMLRGEVRDWCAQLDKNGVARELTALGVNVIGHFCYPSGLRVSVEALVGGLQRVGVATSLRDLRTDKKDDPHHIEFDGFEDFDATIIHTQPEPFFDDAYDRADLFERVPRTYRIAYWYWEFDSIPDAWVAKATQVDEVWAATEFVAKGLREKLKIPVRTLFPGVQLGAYQRRERSYFGLKDGVFTFLFTFHMMSIMERKNPLGLIRAFEQAFAAGEPVQLVLKTSFGDRHPAQLEELRAAASGSNITIIDQVYSPDEVLSLMDACDCYVSLHRSEGLGLTMAEAMLMGKPVIATNYSGNVDFMNDSNSLLVPYERVKLGRPIPPYDADSEWAEPSIEHAAQYMRRIFENQAWARELGAQAKLSAEASLSLEAAGRRVAQRLAEIKAIPKANPSRC